MVAYNSYELELIRLLHKFTQPNDEVSLMVDVSLHRLKNLCFGYQNCFYAECFHAAMVVLRFISAVVPDDKDWLGKQIAGYNRNFPDRKRHGGVRRFFWLCLSDMPFEIAEPEIIRQKEHIIDQLSRSFLVKNENDDIPLYAMRNTLAHLLEYAHIKDIKPHIGEKDGRLRFRLQ